MGNAIGDGEEESAQEVFEEFTREIRALSNLRWGRRQRMGPFENEPIFNLFLRNGMEPAKMENTDERMKADFRSSMDWHRAQEERNPTTVFTHGDANPTNILVKGDKVVGLIDFEMSGFYPEYWEWTTAMNFHYLEGWREEIHNLLTSWPQE